MTDIIIKYALDSATNNVVFIDNAERRFYKCQKCQQQLIPVKGEARKKEWHFRHKDESNCSGGQETLIHKLAKNIICENYKITISDETLIYSLARQEERFDSIIPDVTVLSDGSNIYFEIAVTNPIDILKENFYKSGRHKSIEIDLTDISYNISPDDLKHKVLCQTNNKRKIFWMPIYESNYQTMKDKDRWWAYPAAIFGYFTVAIVFLYFGYKKLTKKKRKFR